MTKVPELAGHLHRHSEFSPLDGTGTANQYSHQALQNGQQWLGLTDHGRLGGALDHVHACRHPEKYDNPLDPDQKRSSDETIMPIVGLEAFYRPDRFMDLKDKEKYGKNGHNWASHLCLHALDLNGWRTLMRLSSKSWVRREDGGGYYGKACIDLDMLKQDNEGICISTACMNSPVSRMILDGDEKGVRRLIKEFQKIAGDHLWFELMPHDLDEQRILNLEYVNLGNELGIPFIATSDAHTPYKDWKDTHSIVRMMSYKQSFNSQERKADAGEDTYTEEIDTVYLCSAEEMFDQFQTYHPDLPVDVVEEAFSNTFEFVDQSKWYVIGKKTKLPKVKVNAKDVLYEWCQEGLHKIADEYPETHWDQWDFETYEERFKMEWDVLVEKGVLDYFYIVGDFVRWAKSDLPIPTLSKGGKLIYDPEDSKKPIRVGLGRGSAAGCLISYLIGITAIDPIPHKLLFERFLNPDREGMPDIDMDFEGGDDTGRGLVKLYLRAVYGDDHVADIIAYSTFAPRASIKDVGAVFDLSQTELKSVSETIGETERGLEKIVKTNPVVEKFKADHPEVWEHLLRLEDQVRNDSKHAGGVVITDKPTSFYLPTQLGKDEKSTVTAFSDRIDMPIVSMYGLVKYDILGVVGLNKQQLCIDLIKENYGDIVEPNELSALRDPRDVEGPVIDAFVKGLSVLVFQFGGRGITQLLRHIKPDSATDIAVANALYRPGPIKLAFEYGDRKNGKTKWEFWDDSLEPVLGETYGIIAFQEQVMETAKRLANYTGGQADGLRKAISKWYRLGKEECILKLKDEGYEELWMQGCRDNGIKDDVAWMVWEQILEFAGYGFNRSHSASYALQAYQDMWLKVHYPLAFYAAGLSIEKKTKPEEQILFLKSVFREATEFDIEIAPPDVNLSDRSWTIDKNKIRYGLVSVKNIGGAHVDSIKENRPYDSFDDFITNVPTTVGVGVSKSLAMAGGFDAIDDRYHLLSRTPKREDGAAELKIKMECGCVKSRTVKPDGSDEPMEEQISRVLDTVECKNHPDSDIKDWKQLDDTITVIEYMKAKGKEPEFAVAPSQKDIMEAEEEVLGVSLSIGSVVTRYYDFLSERVYTEQEVEDVPDKPKRKRMDHMNDCSCRKCNASRVIVGGEITNIKVIKTKTKQEEMAFIDVAFGANQYSCTLFPDTYAEYSELIRSPTAILIAGFKDSSRGQTAIIVDEIEDVVELAEELGWNKKPKKKLKKRKVALNAS